MQTGQRFLADGLASKQALTHDIVWMEERVIDGETVLTPLLYLAKVDASGSTVNLTSLTGDIINDRTAVQFQLGVGSTDTANP